MTNGEMLQKIYSNLEYKILSHTVITNIDNGAWFSLDWWNADYKEPTKNDLGVDCIDRAQAQTEIEMNAFRYTLAKERGGTGEVEWNSHLISIDDAVDIIRNLPSVTPQEPKTGHWIYDYTSADGHRTYHCSECGCYLQPKHSEPLRSFKWCSLCGAKMVESQESEDKE